LRIDWQRAEPRLTLQILDVNTQVQLEKSIALSELQSP